MTIFMKHNFSHQVIVTKKKKREANENPWRREDHPSQGEQRGMGLSLAMKPPLEVQVKEVPLPICSSIRQVCNSMAHRPADSITQPSWDTKQFNLWGACSTWTACWRNDRYKHTLFSTFLSSLCPKEPTKPYKGVAGIGSLIKAQLYHRVSWHSIHIQTATTLKRIDGSWCTHTVRIFWD